MTDVASLSVSATETGVAKVDSALLGLAKSAGVAEAATGRFSAASQKAARDNYTAWQSAGSALPAFSAAVGRSSPIVRAAGGEMKNYGMHTANVFAQLNDIGMMMAAGQNPLTLALQQGTQLNQVWGQMGGKVGAIGAVLRGAFMSLLNPLNLVTIGVIAGGAALFNYFSGGGAGVKTFKDNIDELETAIGTLNDVTNMYSEDGLAKLKEKYGTVNAEIMKLVENQKILALDEAARKLQSVLSSMGSELGSGWLTTASGEVANLFEVSGRKATMLYGDMKAIKDLKTFDEQAAALGKLRDLLSVATDGFTNMTSEQSAMFGKLVDAESQMRILEQSTRKAENAAVDLTGSAPGAGWMASAISETNMLIGKLTKAAEIARMAVAPQNQFDRGNKTYSGRGGDPRATGGFNPSQGIIDAADALLNPSSGSSSGGGGGSDPYQANLDRLMSSLMTERETVEKWYADNEVILNDRRAMELLGAAGHKEAMLDLERQYHEKLSKIKDDSASMSLTGMSTYFGELNSIAGGGFDGLIRAQKSFAAAQLAIDQVKALSAIWGDASIPFLAKGFAIGRTLAAFAGLKSALSGGKGASGGGSSKAPTSVGGASTEPTRTTTVNFQGDPFMVAIAESVMSQMYEASGNGRVLIKA